MTSEVARIHFALAKLDLVGGNRWQSIRYGRSMWNNPKLNKPLLGVAPINDHNLILWNASAFDQIGFQTSRPGISFTLFWKSPAEPTTTVNDNQSFCGWFVLQSDRKIIQPRHFILAFNVAKFVERTCWSRHPDAVRAKRQPNNDQQTSEDRRHVHSTQSAIKIFVSPGSASLRFEAKTNFFPFGENIGKPSKVGLKVIRSRPLPSTLIM